MAQDAPTPHTPWPRAVLVGVLVSLVGTLLILAFLWPSKTSTAHHLPVSVAGPAASVTALKDAVSQASPDTFTFIDANDRADAEHQVKTRESYGAIVLSAPPAAPEVLTAPAGSAVATQMLTGVAATLQTQLTAQAQAAGLPADQLAKLKVTVTPVVPLSSTDPTGSGLSAAAFPLTLGGMIGGVMITLLVAGPVRRLAALAGLGVAAGLLFTLVLQTWFDYLQGDFLINALAMGLSVIATSAFVVGCAALIGTPGIGIGAVVTVLVANPLSAAAAPWQFIAAPWGAIGQFLVPGASNWLIRSLSYFPEANNTQQWLTLAGWLALGVLLTVAGHFRAKGSLKSAAPEPAPDSDQPAEHAHAGAHAAA